MGWVGLTLKLLEPPWAFISRTTMNRWSSSRISSSCILCVIIQLKFSWVQLSPRSPILYEIMSVEREWNEHWLGSIDLFNNAASCILIVLLFQAVNTMRVLLLFDLWIDLRSDTQTHVHTCQWVHSRDVNTHFNLLVSITLFIPFKLLPQWNEPCNYFNL
jgi:hypothetical protein